MENFKVSIAIPTYNRGNYLLNLLESIFSKYGNSNLIQVCVSDNHSSDNTLSILDKFKKYRNFKFNINPSNLGYDRNILKLVEISSGDYIFFLGDDDSLMISNFDHLVSNLLLMFDFDCIFLNYFIENSKKASFISAYSITETKLNLRLNYILNLGHRISFLSSIVIKKSIINNDNLLKFIGYNFMHLAICFDSLIYSNSIALYHNPVVFSFDNGISKYNVEKYFDIDLSFILYSFFPDKKVLLKFNKSLFNFLFPYLILKKKRSFIYYFSKYKNFKSLLLFFPSFINRRLYYIYHWFSNKYLN
jgi:glycosyltransferase involved in cell wall biosynthesis